MEGDEPVELKHIARREGRLSSFLKEEMQMSSGLINRLKWQEKIFVNRKPEHNDFRVRSGDVITVPLDEEEPDYPPEEGEISIIYEDEWLMAVEKPAGMLIHPSRACNSGTLANFVLGYYQKTGQRSAFHPVTRLDRDTFGIVLLTKNAHIHALVQTTPMKKTYHALTLGGPEEDSGTIDAPIARKPLPSLLREIREDGKPSLTEFRVLERGEKLCKLELHPITGRTHQLRVHCAHLGFPIIGDPQYGGEKAMEFGWSSQALCAKRLEFVHPVTGEAMNLASGMDV